MSVALRLAAVLIGCVGACLTSKDSCLASDLQASFQLLPGTRSAWAVSGDGSTVIGSTGLGVSYNTYRWTEATGIQLLGRRLQLRDLSFDGDIIVGSEIGGPGFRWSATQGTLNAPGHVIEVRGSSTHGDFLTGSYSGPAGREAYRWSDSDGLIPIGDLPGGNYFSVAQAISGDGSAIVGQSASEYGLEPFLWTEAEGMRSLGDITGERFQGNAFDISDDGKVVVGLRREGSVSEAFIWSREGGRHDLGHLPGGALYSFASGVSGDGSVVVGIGRDGEGEAAFVWDRFNGMRSLRDVLRDNFGVETGVRLHSARDVSSDGRTIIGTAINTAGEYQGYVAFLPYIIPEPTSSTLLVIVGAALIRSRFAIRLAQS